MIYKIVKAIVMPIVHLLFNIKYVGRENLTQGRGYIICSNHRSMLDPVFIALGVKKRKLRFMAKKELFKNKIFAALITKFGAFPVDRGKGDTTAIKNAENVLNRKHVLLIFPEGTRSKNGKLLRAKSGTAYIASACNCDVIPAAICYDEKGLSFRKKITVCYGKPIKNEEIAIRPEFKIADTRRATAIIMDRIAEMLNMHIKNPVERIEIPEKKQSKKENLNEN